jgi:predicted RNA-binding Zn ribbon-like protein
MGANQLVDMAIKMREPIEAFLRQKSTEHVTFPAAVEALTRLARLRSGLYLQDDKQPAATNTPAKPAPRRAPVRPAAAGVKK